jgi:hypothetical protein
VTPPQEGIGGLPDSPQEEIGFRTSSPTIVFAVILEGHPIHEISGGERQGAGEHLVEGDAERIEVAAGVLGFGDGWGNRDRYRLRDLVLYREDICKIAVVVVGLDVLAGLSLNQLRGHPGAIASSAHAAFEHIPYAQLAADLPHIDDAGIMAQIPVTGLWLINVKTLLDNHSLSCFL